MYLGVFVPYCNVTPCDKHLVADYKNFKRETFEICLELPVPHWSRLQNPSKSLQNWLQTQRPSLQEVLLLGRVLCASGFPAVLRGCHTSPCTKTECTGMEVEARGWAGDSSCPTGSAGQGELGVWALGQHMELSSVRNDSTALALPRALLLYHLFPLFHWWKAKIFRSPFA